MVEIVSGPYARLACFHNEKKIGGSEGGAGQILSLSLKSFILGLKLSSY
jgi:hypothetical protein